MKKIFYWLIPLFVLLLWMASWWAIPYYIPEGWNNRGLSGDMFGSINALFSGLAMAGVIIAIFMQREELSLQREELKLTREELSRHAKAQEESSKALAKQVKMMDETAYLNAMATGIKNCDDAISTQITAMRDAAMRKKVALIETLDKELDLIYNRNA